MPFTYPKRDSRLLALIVPGRPSKRRRGVWPTLAPRIITGTRNSQDGAHQLDLVLGRMLLDETIFRLPSLAKKAMAFFYDVSLLARSGQLAPQPAHLVITGLHLAVARKGFIPIIK